MEPETEEMDRNPMRSGGRKPRRSTVTLRGDGPNKTIKGQKSSGLKKNHPTHVVYKKLTLSTTKRLKVKDRKRGTVQIIIIIIIPIPIPVRRRRRTMKGGEGRDWVTQGHAAEG